MKTAMMKTGFHIQIAFLVLVTSLMTITSSAQAQTSASYLYRLSDFSGPVASLWARVAVDQEEGEIYTLNRSDSVIQIFNETAMQIFDCGEDMALSSAIDIAVADNGELYVLYRTPTATIRHLNYRGELISEIRIADQEQGIQDFSPAYIDYKAGSLYLADTGKMQVIVASATGEIQSRFDFRQKIEGQIRTEMKDETIRESQRKRLQDKLAAIKGADLTGFSVDNKGTIYFTIAPLFAAFRATAENKLEEFGIPGGAPGKFGVIASISADSKGNIFVSDRLRCVVLMFDSSFNFLTEFGYRGEQPDNLVVPDDIAIDERNNRIYVSQAANLGISVFSIHYN
ncbi:6-bladed beta-propeller [uncultured Desulfuromusa sp.]|uniref:6-bladed beta-propeller n=1 Tax=uncultured Desulfuromusa sp. TaxID=219183 RepID=UPI003749F3B1